MKKLVLCSDGTGNSSAKAQKTNVWRVFQAVDQTTPAQLAMYDDGVGNSSIKFLAVLGGVCGYGLKRNVVDLYKFVCRNYAPGDDIYAFGFSRGAFTIRVLAALIDSQGLVSGRSETELHAHAVLAYRRYRNARYPSWSPVVWLGRRLRDALLWFSTREAAAHLATLPPERQPGSVPIRFLGLWDTVAAYGMPVDELKWGISLLIWPMEAVDHHLGLHVQRACHALALDEQRQTFHPVLFDETHEAQLVAAGRVPAGRLTQVWFAGVHSNVGGGYPEDRQSLVTLDWMMSQATAAGLSLDTSAMKEVADGKSAYARLYDSRQGLGAYYRYGPRHVDMGDDALGQPVRAIVHGSVVMRMAGGSDAYAPITLPALFDVLAPDGSLVPMEGFENEAVRAVPRPLLPPSTTAVARIADRTAALQDAIAAIGVPDVALVGQVRDTMWWRRATYFACLFFTLLLVAFPFAATIYAGLVDRAIAGVDPSLGGDARAASAWLDATLAGILSPWMGVLKSLAPGWSGPWLDALALRPFEMIVALLLVALPFFAGIFLAQRIHDRAWFAWHPARRAGYVEWVKSSARRALVVSVVLLAASVALAVVASVQAWQAQLVGLVRLAVVAFAIATAWRTRIVLRLRHLDAASVPTTPTLQLARALRTSTTVDVAVYAVGRVLVPLAFALALLWGIVGVVGHLFSRTLDSSGAFCTPAVAPREIGQDFVEAPSPFAAASLCWASGLQVHAGRRYEAVLDATGSDWFDRRLPAGVAGLPRLTAVHALATPIKRTWSPDWFVPLLRVGTMGNDERVIPPDAAAAAHAGTGRLVFTATQDGQVFVYVNDAVSPMPGTAAFFYDNNRGAATLRMREIAALPVSP